MNSGADKPRTIGLCVSCIHNESQQQIYREIRKLMPDGYSLLIFNAFVDFYDDGSYNIGEKSIFSIIPYHIIDALIIVSESIKRQSILDELVSEALQMGVPVISLDKPLAGCINVTYSYESTMEQIIRHVVEHHNCRRINFIAGIKDNSYSNERLSAYKRVLAEYDIPIEEERIGYGDFWDEPAKAVVRKFLSSEDGLPDAIICANDTMAMAACQELSDHGFNVPDDIIVTGFDGITAEQYHTPRLTTARLDIEKAAMLIMEILENLFMGKQVEEKYMVSHSVVFSQSCGCQPVKHTEANKHIRLLNDKIARMTYYTHNMSKMISRLSGLSIEDAFLGLRHYVDKLAMPSVVICAAENYMSPKPEDENIGFMTKNAVTVFNKRHGNYLEAGDTFRVSELAPDLSDLLSEKNTVIVLPIHFQDKVHAYLLATIPEKFDDFSLLYLLQMNVNQLMGLLHSQYCLQSALEDMKQMYSHDYMTQLYNRRGFYEQIDDLIENAADNNLSLIICSVDMNGLKYINDYYGHQEGDFAIKQTALALSSSAGKDALCSRFGGDEFMVAMLSKDPAAEGDKYCSDVRKKLEHINSFWEKPYEISASFGISYSEPGMSIALNNLIFHADERMYAAKASSPHFRGKS